MGFWDMPISSINQQLWHPSWSPTSNQNARKNNVKQEQFYVINSEICVSEGTGGILSYKETYKCKY